MIWGYGIQIHSSIYDLWCIDVVIIAQCVKCNVYHSTIKVTRVCIILAKHHMAENNYVLLRKYECDLPFYINFQAKQKILALYNVALFTPAHTSAILGFCTWTEHNTLAASVLFGTYVRSGAGLPPVEEHTKATSSPLITFPLPSTSTCGSPGRSGRKNVLISHRPKTFKTLCDKNKGEEKDFTDDHVKYKLHTNNIWHLYQLEKNLQ